MGGVADLKHSLADREQAACREIADAEVEVDVDLIAGQRHRVRPARDLFGCPGVHHGHLPLRVCRPARPGAAAAGEPVVPFEPRHRVEHRLIRKFPHADGWAPDHQDHLAVTGGRFTDRTEARFQPLAG